MRHFNENDGNDLYAAACARRDAQRAEDARAAEVARAWAAGNEDAFDAPAPAYAFDAADLAALAAYHRGDDPYAGQPASKIDVEVGE